jgi:fluoroacetyl-CoA thioesterase
MDARHVIKIDMSAERRLVVPVERTVGHFVPGMPMVYATPMMILEMEMASADAINPHLENGWVTVGTEVDIRHRLACRRDGADHGESCRGRAPRHPLRGRSF